MQKLHSTQSVHTLRARPKPPGAFRTLFGATISGPPVQVRSSSPKRCGKKAAHFLTTKRGAIFSLSSSGCRPFFRQLVACKETSVSSHLFAAAQKWSPKSGLDFSQRNRKSKGGLLLLLFRLSDELSCSSAHCQGGFSSDETRGKRMRPFQQVALSHLLAPNLHKPHDLTGKK